MVPIQFGLQSFYSMQLRSSNLSCFVGSYKTLVHETKGWVESKDLLPAAGVVGLSGLPWSSSWQTCQLVFSETRDPAGPSTFLHHSMHDAASSSWVYGAK